MRQMWIPSLSFNTLNLFLSFSFFVLHRIIAYLYKVCKILLAGIVGPQQKKDLVSFLFCSVVESSYWDQI